MIISPSGGTADTNQTGRSPANPRDYADTKTPPTALTRSSARPGRATAARPGLRAGAHGPAGGAGCAAGSRPAAPPVMGAGAAEAGHAGDHPAGRALDARPGYHRAAGH